MSTGAAVENGGGYQSEANRRIPKTFPEHFLAAVEQTSVQGGSSLNADVCPTSRGTVRSLIESDICLKALQQRHETLCEEHGGPANIPNAAVKHQWYNRLVTSRIQLQGVALRTLLIESCDWETDDGAAQVSQLSASLPRLVSLRQELATSPFAQKQRPGDKALEFRVHMLLWTASIRTVTRSVAARQAVFERAMGHVGDAASSAASSTARSAALVAESQTLAALSGKHEAIALASDAVAADPSSIQAWATHFVLLLSSPLAIKAVVETSYQSIDRLFGTNMLVPFLGALAANVEGSDATPPLHELIQRISNFAVVSSSKFRTNGASNDPPSAVIADATRSVSLGGFGQPNRMRLCDALVLMCCLGGEVAKDARVKEAVVSLASLGGWLAAKFTPSRRVTAMLCVLQAHASRTRREAGQLLVRGVTVHPGPEVLTALGAVIQPPLDSSDSGPSAAEVESVGRRGSVDAMSVLSDGSRFGGSTTTGLVNGDWSTSMMDGSTYLSSPLAARANGVIPPRPGSSYAPTELADELTVYVRSTAALPDAEVYHKGDMALAQHYTETAVKTDPMYWPAQMQLARQLESVGDRRSCGSVMLAAAEIENSVAGGGIKGIRLAALFDLINAWASA